MVGCWSFKVMSALVIVSILVFGVLMILGVQVFRIGSV